MANNDRWREDQERNRYRDDVRRRGDRNPGYGRGSDYESSGYARDYGRDERSRSSRGTEGIGDIYGGGGASGSDYRSAGMAGRDRDRWESRGFGREDHGRGSQEQGFGGNDYSRGF